VDNPADGLVCVHPQEWRGKEATGAGLACTN